MRDRVLSANAYVGSTPIVEALGRGANVVVTGRSTDTALTMAPLRYEFGWGAGDWDRLAAGIVAAVVGAVVQIAGMLVERWLFFAEAKHTVTLYYGR